MKLQNPSTNSRDMESDEYLPILLVSAKDTNAAAAIISEIVDMKSEEEINRNELDCMWKIKNKYYTADVRVLALLDGQDLEAPLQEYVEAHLIYLTQDECNEETAVETMQRRSEAGAAAHVRLAVADADADPPALAAAAARERRELVALRERAPDGDDARDERGAARVRAALHAHLWPGLRRLPRPPRPQPAASPDDEWSEWCSGPAEGGADGDEAFLAALSALPGAAAAARRGGGSREERLERAERLVAAFCHALGTPFD